MFLCVISNWISLTFAIIKCWYYFNAIWKLEYLHAKNLKLVEKLKKKQITRLRKCIQIELTKFQIDLDWKHLKTPRND